MSTVIRTLVVLLAVTAFATPAVAGEGRTPIPFTAPVTTPILITDPGSYVVTRNLTATGPGAVIEIATPPGADVDLDLNGMVLTAAAGERAIAVLGTQSEVTIRNGSLVGGAHGIDAFGVSREVIVEDVKVSDTTDTAIWIRDAEITIVRRCVVTDAGNLGIAIEGGVRQAKIEDNDVRRTQDGICLFEVEGAEVSNNRVKEVVIGGSFQVGILLDSVSTCLVTQNIVQSVAGATGDGIRLASSSGCKVYNNAVADAGGSGIELDGTSDTLVLDNVVRGSGLHGLAVTGSGNQIDRNVFNANGGSGTGFGIWFGAVSAENSFGRNTAVGNTGGTCAFTPWSNDLCDENAAPGTVNISFGDNLVPPSAGAF